MDQLALTDDGRISHSAGDADRLRQAARQIEGMFVQLLMQQMNEQSSFAGEDPLLGDSPGSKQYNQLLNGALGERMAGSLGVADLVYRQLATRLGIERGAPGAGGSP